MTFIFLFLYNIFYAFIFIPLFIIGSIFNTKMRNSLAARATQWKKIKTFSRLNKNSKIIFFHSASVGEWEQSLPIIKELKAQDSSIKIIASFFSPSGIKHAKQEDVDLSIYLPFDLSIIAYKFFKQIKPAVWVISKYDVWPSFIYGAHKAKVPIILSSAELAEDSTRYKGIFAKINSVFYKYIDFIMPVSQDYLERFKNFYPYPEKLIVSGDARYDQIISKSENISLQNSIQIFTTPKPIRFIAGSIWPADEKHLLPALLKLKKEFTELQFVLVPHELHESHIKSIEEFWHKENITTDRYSNFSQKGTTTADIAIINSIGILATLYKDSDIVYVGGAFTTGVHNVAEPAVFGSPVVYGPKHINSFEAVQLKLINAGFEITNETDCYEILKKLITNETFRKESGELGKEFIYKNKGATETILKVINNFI